MDELCVHHVLDRVMPSGLYRCDVCRELFGVIPMLDDGFGNMWQKCAAGDQCRMQIARPGKVQCDCWQPADSASEGQK